MHFHQNNTFPKANETSDNAHHNTCTDYPPITAQCIYRVATIPTSFQPHPPQYVARPHTQLHTQYLLQHTQLFILITINQDTLSPSNNRPYIFIHNHYILHKTQHPTLQPTQTFTGTLLLSKCTSLHKSCIDKHKPSRAIPHNTTLLPMKKTHINRNTAYSTKLTTLNLHFTNRTYIDLPYKEPALTVISQHTHKT